MTRTAPAARWIAATAALCAAALVGAWLLLLGPMLDAAAATRAQAGEVQQQNAAQAARLETLRADFAEIDAFRAELASLRLQLPDAAALTQLSREIDAAARAAGVTLVRVEVAEALDVQAAAAAAAAAGTAAPAQTADTAAAADGTATAAEGAPATDTTTTATTTAGAVPTAPPVPGMLTIPLATTVAGSVDGVRAFLTALQLGLSRGLLVTTLGVTALDESTGADGTRPAAAGDVEAVIGALAYVLPATDGTAPVDVDGPLPLSTGRSAFLSAAPQAADAPAAPAPDPAVAAADAIASAVEQRLAAATAAAAEAAAASAAAQASAPVTSPATGDDGASGAPDAGTD